MNDRITKDNEYKDIKVSELGYRELNAEEKVLVQKFVKEYNGTFYILFVVFFIFGCLLTALVVYNVFWLGDNDALSTLAIVFIFFLVAFFIFKMAIPKNKSCVKVQDGVLNGVWRRVSVSGSGKNEHFYLDVIFPLNGTRLRKTNCSLEDYKKGKVGSKVLVFAFDNRKAFGIVSNYSDYNTQK